MSRSIRILKAVQNFPMPCDGSYDDRKSQESADLSSDTELSLDTRDLCSFSQPLGSEDGIAALLSSEAYIERQPTEDTFAGESDAFDIALSYSGISDLGFETNLNEEMVITHTSQDSIKDDADNNSSKFKIYNADADQTGCITGCFTLSQNNRRSDLGMHAEEDVYSIRIPATPPSAAKDCMPFMSLNIASDSNISFLNNNVSFVETGLADSSVETGFVTGSNRKISVDRARLENGMAMLSKEIAGAKGCGPIDDQIGAAQKGEAFSLSAFCGGFMTGKNKKIILSDEKLNEGLALFKKHRLADSDRGELGKAQDLATAPGLIRSYHCPVVGHASTEARNLEEMKRCYDKARRYFKRQGEDWVAIQFKWAWLHLFINPCDAKDNLEDAIIDIIKLRGGKEHSVLRRIVEFDDVALRHMILGILRVTPEAVELYDGFYSVWAEIDQPIYNMLKAGKCDMGSKIHVFGADLLLSQATDIFEVEGNVLRLHYNGVRITNIQCCLGYRKKIAFLNDISSIRRDGGTVSAVVVTVQKIVECRYLVKAENYRNITDDPEKEIDRIQALAVKAGKDIRDINLRVKRFTKMLVADETGECLLTWWGAEDDVRRNDRYKFVCITPVPSSVGLHLSTSNKSYVEKLKD